VEGLLGEQGRGRIEDQVPAVGSFGLLELQECGLVVHFWASPGMKLSHGFSGFSFASGKSETFLIDLKR
jgi:hypothetical protein